MSKFSPGDLVIVNSPSLKGQILEVSASYISGSTYYILIDEQGQEINVWVREDNLELVFSV